MAKETTAPAFDFDALLGHGAATADQGFVTLQWHNGDPKLEKLGADDLNYRGGAFVKAALVGMDNEQFAAAATLVKAPYKADPPDTHVWYLGPDIEIAVLASRYEAYVGEYPNITFVDPFDSSYVDSVKRSRALVFVKGLEAWHKENGPLMLTVTRSNSFAMSVLTLGHSANRALIRTQDNQNPDYKGNWTSRVYMPLRKALGDTLAFYSLYVPITTGAHTLPNPKYTSSYTTPPMLNGALIPFDVLPKDDPAAMQSFVADRFIGAEMMALASDHWDSAQAWAETDLSTDTPSEPETEASAADVQNMINELSGAE